MGSARVTWDGSSAHLTLGGVGLEVGRVVEVEVAPRSSEASRSLGRMVGVYSGAGTLALSWEEARRWLEVADRLRRPSWAWAGWDPGR